MSEFTRLPKIIFEILSTSFKKFFTLWAIPAVNESAGFRYK